MHFQKKKFILFDIFIHVNNIAPLNIKKIPEEQNKEKVFDKSVANALANSEIDTTNVKLKNNTK